MGATKEERIARILRARADAVAGGDVAAYVARLRASRAHEGREWREVLRELAIGESFFFRDHAQFQLLRDVIVPKLMDLRSEQRELRFWSAGCSTGEEPYSLAILACEVLGPDSGWDVSIVGTDVNAEALDHAREGVYGAWSLRALTPDERARYFQEEDGGFRLRARFRDMVTFETGNLVKDRVPGFATGLHDMDLVLCRNVFIYFGLATASRVADKLAHALRPGGFLMTGHSEIHGEYPPLLRPRVLPGSVVYERPPFGIAAGVDEAAASRRAPEKAPVPRRAASERDGGGLLARAEAAFARAQYVDAMRVAEEHLREAPRDEAALRLVAVAAANLGEHVRAARYCRRLLREHPGDMEGRYLLAKLAADRGNDPEAREILGRLIDDYPSFVPAYLDLAWLEDRRAGWARSSELREAALRILERRGDSAILGAYEGLTAEDLVAQLGPRVKSDPPAGGES